MNKNPIIVALLFSVVLSGCMENQKDPEKGSSESTTRENFLPGQEWYDTQSELIQAHGGGFLYDNGTHYWYGENKNGITQFPRLRVDVIGINCYSSKDLYNWKNEGLVLPAVENDSTHDLHPSRVAERPKVIYNEMTGKYVMWLHVDNFEYQDSKVGIAVSDTPAGPFEYKGSFRPLGKKSTDMTLFKDSDNKAYLICGADWHSKIIIAELSDDYLSLSGKHSIILECEGPPYGREAPAMFRWNDRYFLITSGTTGWSSNAAQYDVATNIFGPYTTKGNPCKGMWSELTFFAQSTYVIPVQEEDDKFIFVADRWNLTDLKNSRYLFLPIELYEPDSIAINWVDEWKL